MNFPQDIKCIEEETYRLKGQQAAGRITPEQFEAARQQLLAQDDTGHWWMFDAERGKWLMSDGANWVEARLPDQLSYSPPPSIPPYYQAAPPPKPPAPKRSGCWGGSACILITLALLAVVALGAIGVVALGAWVSPNAPQILGSIVTAIAPTRTPTVKPAFDLCTLMPAEVTNVNKNLNSPYIIADGEGDAMVYPRSICFANSAQDEKIRVALETYYSIAKMQRAERFFRACKISPGYTCTPIQLGDGGYESDSPDDPTCDLDINTHRLTWHHGCILAKVEIHSTSITEENIKQIWTLAKLVNTKLESAPECPE